MPQDNLKESLEAKLKEKIEAKKKDIAAVIEVAMSKGASEARYTFCDASADYIAIYAQWLDDIGLSVKVERAQPNQPPKTPMEAATRKIMTGVEHDTRIKDEIVVDLTPFYLSAK